MEKRYGCNLQNTAVDGRMPSEFTDEYHVHILVRRGEMEFFDGKNLFTSHKDDLVIWQMSNRISRVSYSADFEADFLIVDSQFLLHYNPEMIWATKGFIFIRLNPTFRLEGESLTLKEADFRLFRFRLEQTSPIVWCCDASPCTSAAMYG